jgi:uncharacterized membrane protein
MRTVLIVAFVLSLILIAVSYTMMPDQIASHFGAGGEPDGWSSRNFFTVMMLFIDTLMFVMFFWSPLLLDKFDKRWLSLPNRDYWLTDARLPRAKQILVNYMAEFGVATFALLGYAKWSTLQANLGDEPRLRESVFIWVIVLYMVYTLVWCVRLIVAFRIPKGESA